MKLTLFVPVELAVLIVPQFVSVMSHESVDSTVVPDHVTLKVSTVQLPLPVTMNALLVMFLTDELPAALLLYMLSVPE